MLRQGFFDSAGVQLHYIDWGGHGRGVLLLAGLGGTAPVYRGLAPRLAKGFRVAALTRRGHGRSDRPDAGYDIETLVEDIRRFLNFLDFQRATLIGHSWSGLEIPRFAVKYPERVEAVVYLDALHVLLEPAPDPAADPVWNVLDAQPRAEDVASAESYIAYLKRSRRDLASIWCEAIEADRLEDLPRVQADYARPLHERHSYKVTRMMEDGLGPHGDPAYGDVTAPALALVLGGTTHPFLPTHATNELEAAANAYYMKSFVPRIKRRTELFREAVPHARIIELDTSNHTIFVAKEDETVAEISDFLVGRGGAMDTKPASIEAYLATLPDDARAALEKVRRAIRASAPEAVESIGYGMPAFKYKGRPLIYFAAAKSHCAVYGPAVAEHQEALAGYDASKGTIRFSPTKPLPASLVKKLVRARMAAIDAAERKGKTTAAGKRKGSAGSKRR